MKNQEEKDKKEQMANKNDTKKREGKTPSDSADFVAEIVGEEGSKGKRMSAGGRFCSILSPQSAPFI